MIAIGVRCVKRFRRLSPSIPEYLHRLGLKAYEPPINEDDVGIASDDLRLLATEAQRFGIILGVHAPVKIHLASLHPLVVSKSIEKIKQALHIALILKAHIAVIHLGWYVGDRAESIRRVIENLKQLEDYVKSEGVWLGIETAGRKTEIGTLTEVINVCRSIERAKPVIDWAHLYARSGGRFIKDVEDVIRVVDIVKKELDKKDKKALHPLWTHYTKAVLDKDGEIQHAPLSDPNAGPDPRVVIKGLKEAGINSVVISELPKCEEDAKSLKGLVLQSS